MYFYLHLNLKLHHFPSYAPCFQQKKEVFRPKLHQMPASVDKGAKCQRSNSMQLLPVLLHMQDTPLCTRDAPPCMDSAFQSYLYLLTNNLYTSIFCWFFTAAKQLGFFISHIISLL